MGADRALRARTKTPLALALRGRFLVGSRPVAGDFVRRFVATAAESGIDVFRLHDPLNDVSNLREASEAITAAEREFDAGLVYSAGPSGEVETLVAQAERLPELGAARVLIHDPSGSLEPHRVRELVEAVREASNLPVGLYCQGAGGGALAAAIEAARAGADLIATAVYPVALVLHRASGEAVASTLGGLGLETGVTADELGGPPISSTSTSATSPSLRLHRGSRRARRSTAFPPGSSQPSTCTSGRRAPATGSTR